MIGMDELIQIYSHYDGDGNGRIDRSEFKRLMGALGAHASEEELNLGFDAIDENGSGTIDFHEFKGWWIDRYR